MAEFRRFGDPDNCGHRWIVSESENSATGAECIRKRGHEGFHSSPGVITDWPVVIHGWVNEREKENGR